MNSRMRIAAPWIAIVVIAIVAALLRYMVVEPQYMQHACEEGVAPWWCSARLAVVQGFLTYGYGYAAVAAAVLALVWRHPFSAALATALGLVALQLYCFEAGALALLIGALRLIRIQYDERTAEAAR
ncbi:hypothetical protein EC912_102479 [Luteibacter rhizovicinus]|uniref:Uncharacterized protein n=1 Tax=Luteibacter rhizovicinus TaxID=242606 RepID=A0A4V2W4N9_9GAMM|nr:hypothetical protein [Luteibacter rhizovicinus]TCV96129.1 hypothetical protein EC912_102479 [Luteibacter rhizovicinus]